MAPRRNNRPQPARRRPPAPASAGFRALRFGLLALAAIVIAAGAWWTLRPGAAPPGAPDGGPGTTAIAPGPPSPEAAQQALLEGSRAASPAAAIPRLRLAVQGLPQSWEAHVLLATALENAALETVVRAGRSEPRTRSSLERIALVSEGLRETEVALPLVPEAWRRAAILRHEAKVLRIWGMPVDALELALRAQALDPSHAEGTSLVAELDAELRSGGIAP